MLNNIRTHRGLPTVIRDDEYLLKVAIRRNKDDGKLTPSRLLAALQVSPSLTTRAVTGKK
jgi:hypothetical protein